MSKPFGHELILDLGGCDTDRFNRKDLTRFFKTLCKKMDMTPTDLHFWDDEGVPEEEIETPKHLRGVSAVQFIITSSIVLHSLEASGRVYLNVFSCKEFDSKVVVKYCKGFFKALSVDVRATVERI